MLASTIFCEPTFSSQATLTLPYCRESSQGNHFVGQALIIQGNHEFLARANFLTQFLNSNLHISKELNSREVTRNSKSSCLFGLTSGIAASFLLENPLLLLLGLSECFSRVYAQQKVGNEFQVNTYTNNTQEYTSVASFSNGNFVVTWQSYGQDGDGYGIYGQLFDENGSKIGTEFQVNSYVPSSQQRPSVASFSNDHFIVTWGSFSQDGSGYGVYGQLFDGNGTKIGSEFQVNTYANNGQMSPSVASFSNGNFVVTWTSNGQDGSGYGVYGQLFNGNSSKIGIEFQANTHTTNNQQIGSLRSLASLGNGRFVVTWMSEGQEPGWGVYGQLFNRSGFKIGSEFRVNTYITSHQETPSVASFSNGNFVVTWNSNDQDGSGYEIYGQLFDGNGTKIGSEFRANSYTTNSQYNPSVASFNNGNFVVTWESYVQDGSGGGIYGQLFDGNGAKLGNEFRANSYTTNDQWSPSVASFNNGNFVVTWHSDGQDGADHGVFGQIFHDNITTPSTSSTTSPTPATDTFGSSNSKRNSNTKTTSSLTSDISNEIIPTSSISNNRFLWLWLLLGIGSGTTCIGLIGYFLLKKRRGQRENHSLPFELSTFSPSDPERNLSDRDEKGHTRIGGKYDLINKIARDEAQTLLAQTGILVEFPSEQYRTKVLLGEGNFGKLRIARDLHGRYIGVKKIKGADEIAQSRSEGRLQAKLEGKPNIMPILDFVESESSQKKPVLYQFMPLAGFGNGEKLRDHLAALTDPACKERILIHVAKGLLTGLFHMHQSRIYHLDIKPSNMVFDIQGEPFIIDFGCAQELPGELIRDQMTGDTEYYPPERIRFYRQVGRRQQPDPIAADKIDAWASGLTLLELILGFYPFDHTDFFVKITHWDNAYFQKKLNAIPLLENPAPGSLLSIVKDLIIVDPQERLSVETALTQLAHNVAFASPSEQQTTFAHLKQQKLSSAESPAPSVSRAEDERYADVCIRKYGYRFTPDTVAPPGYALTPDFVHQASSSQASSAGLPMRIPPSYDEVMRGE